MGRLGMRVCEYKRAFRTNLLIQQSTFSLIFPLTHNAV